jgi:hypothetical protein
LVRRLRAALLFSFATLLLGLPARADLSIAPAYVEVALDKGAATGSFRISNLADRDERFRINILYFVYGIDGTFSPVREGEFSLADWIKLNPRELDIAAKSERTVRFAVMPPKGIQEGEYWAGIELESLRRFRSQTTAENGATMGVDLVTSVIVPVFGRVGDVAYTGSLKSPALVSAPDGTPTMRVVVANSGAGRFLVEGEYSLRDASGATVASGLFGRGHVYRSNERLFSRAVDAPLPDGTFTASIKFVAPELKQALEISAPVTWKALKPTGR